MRYASRMFSSNSSRVAPWLKTPGMWQDGQRTGAVFPILELEMEGHILPRMAAGEAARVPVPIVHGAVVIPFSLGRIFPVSPFHGPRLERQIGLCISGLTGSFFEARGIHQRDVRLLASEQFLDGQDLDSRILPV